MQRRHAVGGGSTHVGARCQQLLHYACVAVPSCKQQGRPTPRVRRRQPLVARLSCACWQQTCTQAASPDLAASCRAMVSSSSSLSEAAEEGLLGVGDASSCCWTLLEGWLRSLLMLLIPLSPLQQLGASVCAGSSAGRASAVCDMLSVGADMASRIQRRLMEALPSPAAEAPYGAWCLKAAGRQVACTCVRTQQRGSLFTPHPGCQEGPGGLGGGHRFPCLELRARWCSVRVNVDDPTIN